MNSTTSSLKVTVNGKKYLITGIQRETSCKGLLCAIAKVTSQEETLLRTTYGVKTSEIISNENLLERFKGDRELAGDITSLSIFNSLSKDAKIVVKETVAAHKELIIDESTQVHTTSKHHHNKKNKKNKTKESSSSNIKIKEEKSEKKSKHNKHKSHKSQHHHKEKLTTTTTEKIVETTVSTKHRIKHRSVDDSDIETYRRDSLRRMKTKRRTYDDSDIDVYKKIEDIVVDQTKKLHKIQSHTKEVRRSAWMKELHRNSQVYFIDDETSNLKESGANNNTEACVVFEKDDGNDSGLPSPEYDSSESQENQPIIKLKDPIPYDHVLLNINENKAEYIKEVQITDNIQAERSMKDKQTFNTKTNIDTTEECNATTSTKHENYSCDNNLTNKNEEGEENKTIIKQQNNNKTYDSLDEHITIVKENISDRTTTKISANENNENELSETFRLPALENVDKNKNNSEKLMSTELQSKRHEIITTDKNENILSIEGSKENYKSMMLDKNRNILSESTCDLEVSKMVAFNEALFKGSTSTTATTTNALKKLDKKKLKKSDISEPVLMSPGTFKKHQSLKKVQSVLGKQAADVLKKDFLKSHHTTNNEEDLVKQDGKEHKEKEKYYNKKLKEIRKNKKKDKSSKSSTPSTKDDDEPEYLPKAKFTESPPTTSPKHKSSKTTEDSMKTNNIINCSDENTTSKVINEDIKTVQQDTHQSIAVVCEDSSVDITQKTNNSATEMIEKPSNPILTADEILNEILEYERNIKNELDEIIKIDKDEEKHNTQKQNTNNEGSTSKIENDLSSTRHKQQENIIETKNTTPQLDQSKQHRDNKLLLNDKHCLQKTKTQELQNGNQKSDENTNFTTRNVHSQQRTSNLPIQKIKEENSDDQLDSKPNSEESERMEIIENYLYEKKALDEVTDKLLNYNYALTRLTEELEILNIEEEESKSVQDLEAEEFKIHKEIDNIKSLLRSVADLTSYQRKEMTENLEYLDTMDLEIRTRKANYDNLRNGTWKTNSKSAPRSLIKNAKVKRKNSLIASMDGQISNKKASSFV